MADPCVRAGVKSAAYRGSPRRALLPLTTRGFSGDAGDEVHRALGRRANLDQVLDAAVTLVGFRDEQLHEPEDDAKLILKVMDEVASTAHVGFPGTHRRYRAHARCRTAW